MTKDFASTPASLWDSAAPDYEEVSYERKDGAYPANSFRSQILLDFFDRSPKGTVLDAGCGTGQMTRELLQRGWSVVSIDYSAGMIKTAKAKTDAAGLSGSFQQLSLFELEKLDQKFDYIMLNGVLPYIAEAEEGAVFEQLKKVSKPETVLVAAHYNQYFDVFAFDSWTVDLLAKQLSAAGLDQDAISLATAKVSNLLQNADETLDSERTMKTEDPTSYDQKLIKYGFEQFDLAYYNFFYLPAKFQDQQDQKVRSLMEAKLKRDPKGLLFARAFVSFAKRSR